LVCQSPSLDRAHELVGHADRVVGVLAGDGVVRLAVEVGGVARGDERHGLLLLAHLPLDEVDDLGVVHVEADHLGRAARGAARLGAPAARSKTSRKDMRPEEVPPPESFSCRPRMALKFVPVPEPYLKRRASRFTSS
jgi:hypothetical protein